MIDADSYLNALAHRAQAQRARLQNAQVGPLQALVVDSYESFGLSEVRFCVIVAAVPEVNAFIVGDFTRHGVTWASGTVHGVKGVTTSIITIVGLVSPRVAPDAVSAATSKPSMEFSGAHRSVVVDLTGNAVHAYTGSSFREFAISNGIKQKLSTLFLPPSQIAQPGPGLQGPPPGPRQGPYGPPQGQFPPGPPPGQAPPPPPPPPQQQPQQGGWGGW